MEHAPVAPTDFPEKERSSSDPDYDAWFRRQVAEGLADMEARRVSPHEEVKAWIEDQIRTWEASQTR